MPKDTVIVSVYCVMKHHAQEQFGQGKGLFQFTTHRSHIPTVGSQEGTQVGDPEAGSEAEAREGCGFMACLFCFLIQPRTTEIGVEPPTVSWGHHTSVVIPGSSPQTRMWASLLGLFSPLRAPLLRYIEVCVK